MIFPQTKRRFKRSGVPVDRHQHLSTCVALFLSHTDGGGVGLHGGVVLPSRPSRALVGGDVQTSIADHRVLSL